MDDPIRSSLLKSLDSHTDDDPSAQLLSSGRRPNGTFAPGNIESLRHGGRSSRVLAGLMPEQAEAAAALKARVVAIVSDLGGVDALSALSRGLVERHARLELVDDFLFANLQRLGPLTGKGRTRAALTAWLAVVDRLQKSALSLGLERRKRQVPSLVDILNRDAE